MASRGVVGWVGVLVLVSTLVSPTCGSCGAVLRRTRILPRLPGSVTSLFPFIYKGFGVSAGLFCGRVGAFWFGGFRPRDRAAK